MSYNLQTYRNHLPNKIYDLCERNNFFNGDYQERRVDKETDKEGDLNQYRVKVGIYRDDKENPLPFIQREFCYNNRTIITVSSLFKNQKVCMDSCSDNHGYQKLFSLSNQNMSQRTIEKILESIENIFNSKAINHPVPKPSA